MDCHALTPRGWSRRGGRVSPGDLRVGLCAACRHARRIESRRGSAFYLCGRAADDPDFPRYPRLPVIECRGYDAGEPASSEPSSEPSRK